MKKCNKCEKMKSAQHFHKDKSKEDGLSTLCKQCKKEYRRSYYLSNKEKLKSYSSQYYNKNKGRIKEQSRATYREKIDHFKEKRKRQYWANPEKAKRENCRYSTERAKVDPIYRLKLRCRKRIWEAFKKKGYTKKSKSFSLIGCTADELAVYIERQFKEGMSWSNYGQWHIDHIIPLASANTEEEVEKLFHYKNLQPLWASENISKSARIP